MSFEITGDYSIQSAIDAEDARKKDEAELGRTDFLTMLVAQLEHQDPLNPQDASEFSAQLAQFSSLEQLISMKVNLDKLVEAQTDEDGDRDAIGEDLVATNLLDKEVSVFDDRLIVPAAGEAETVSFYLNGAANNVEFDVRDESGTYLYTIPVPHESGPGTSWQAGMNTFEWHRPTGTDDMVRGSGSEVFFDVKASLGDTDVQGEGVAVGTVVSSSMGFDSTLLQLENGRKVDLSNVFEVRRRSEGS